MLYVFIAGYVFPFRYDHEQDRARFGSAFSRLNKKEINSVLASGLFSWYEKEAKQKHITSSKTKPARLQV